jgi:hypothetical protein
MLRFIWPPDEVLRHDDGCHVIFIGYDQGFVAEIECNPLLTDEAVMAAHASQARDLLIALYAADARVELTL